MADVNSRAAELEVEKLNLSFGGIKALHLKVPDPAALIDELRENSYEVH